MELDEIFDAAVLHLESPEKACTKCKQLKSLSEFNWASRTKADKRSNTRRKKAQCKSCDSQEFSTWREANIETVLRKDRAKHYVRKHGLDPAVSLILADAHNRTWRCPICKTKAVLVLDHDHQTGVTRELICSSCNTLLGMAKDNIDILYNAIAYLKKHRGV